MSKADTIELKQTPQIGVQNNTKTNNKKPKKNKLLLIIALAALGIALLAYEVVAPAIVAMSYTNQLIGANSAALKKNTDDMFTVFDTFSNAENSDSATIQSKATLYHSLVSNHVQLLQKMVDEDKKLYRPLPFTGFLFGNFGMNRAHKIVASEYPKAIQLMNLADNTLQFVTQDSLSRRQISTALKSLNEAAKNGSQASYQANLNNFIATIDTQITTLNSTPTDPKLAASKAAYVADLTTLSSLYKQVNSSFNSGNNTAFAQTQHTANDQLILMQTNNNAMLKTIFEPVTSQLTLIDEIFKF